MIVVYSFCGYNFYTFREAVSFKKFYKKRWNRNDKIKKFNYLIGVPKVINWKASKKQGYIIYY